MTCLPYIGIILRSILMPRIVVELDQRKSAAVMDLRGKHETNLVRRCLRLQMNYALNILDCVAVTVTVPQAAVDKGGGT